MRKKIVIFSGAGLDAESGVKTFRDCEDGLWNNYKIEEVATPKAWKDDKEKVLNFYNERRREMLDVVPNEAHDIIASLEQEFEVVNITQNVSDLLERAGCSTVYHLHGSLTKARSTYLSGNPIQERLGVTNQPIDIGYEDINLGDKCEKYGAQLRPHIVWFEEYPFHIEESYEAIRECDILIIVGTSLNITYTLDMLNNVNQLAKIFYVDPSPSNETKYMDLEIEYIKEPATTGLQKVYQLI